jgi:hypothetical protein
MRRSTAHLKLQMASLPAPKSICSRSTKKQLDNNKKISFKIFILSTAPNRNPKRFRGAKKKMLIGPLGPYFYSPFSLKSKNFSPSTTSQLPFRQLPIVDLPHSPVIGDGRISPSLVSTTHPQRESRPQGSSSSWRGSDGFDDLPSPPRLVVKYHVRHRPPALGWRRSTTGTTVRNFGSVHTSRRLMRHGRTTWRTFGSTTTTMAN